VLIDYPEPAVALGPGMLATDAPQLGVWGETYTLSITNNDVVARTFGVSGVNTANFDVDPDATEAVVAAGVTTTIPVRLNITALPGEGQYDVEVVVTDACGALGSEAVTTVYAVDFTAPTTPQGLTANPGIDFVSLLWNASSDAGSGVDYYEILRNGVVVAQSGIPHYVDTGLAQNTTYQYRVRAVDNVGHTSQNSGVVSATTQPSGGCQKCPPPAEP
jgi:hypothetical protein